MARRRYVRGVVAAFSMTMFFMSGVSAGRAATPTYTVAKDQDFHVTHIGPNHDTSCDVFYDLYKPNDASASHQVPAILTTNGFGGSKEDQDGEAALWASHDYEVLSYSGLGFGGSTCLIYADDVDWDGQAASQLVDWLGGAAHPEVLKDAPGDPRIGTWGGSYGGGFQFALAAASTKVDAMVPEITWNDLTYSLLPNDNNPNFVYDYSATAPGVEKFLWSDLFFADGNAQPADAGNTPATIGYSGWTNTNAGPTHAAGAGTPPSPTCPGFPQLVCTENAISTAQGYPTQNIINWLRHASSVSELGGFSGTSGHFPPTMLLQGETDTLFNFGDAIANYNMWKARNRPVKLVFKLGGHSGGDCCGEYNNTDPSKGYLTQLTLNWFDHYLKRDSSISTGPEVEYYKDWVSYPKDGSVSAQVAFGNAPSFPVGNPLTLYLSGGNSMTESGNLVTQLSQVVSGSVTFTNSAPGTSYSDTPEVPQSGPPQPSDPTGQFAAFDTAPLTSNLDVVGVPMADFYLSDANPVSGVDPSLDVVLFGKIYDVDASGNKTLVHRIVSPVRVADLSKPVHINLPGQVYRYAAGHHLEFLLATTDNGYVGSRAQHVLTIAPDKAHPATVTLHVLQSTQAAQTAVPAPTVTAASGGLVNTSTARGWPVIWPATGAVLLVLGLALLGGTVARRRG